MRKTNIFLFVFIICFWADIAYAYERHDAQVSEESPEENASIDKVSNKELNKFLELALNARGNPNGLIYYGRGIFKKGATLPDNYRELMKLYLTREENNEVHFTFLDSHGEYGSYSVKMIIDADSGTVIKYDAIGMKYSR